MGKDRPRTIEVEEVMRYFALANAGKAYFRVGKIFSEEELMSEYEILKEMIWNFSDRELREGIRDKVRLRRYEERNWQFSESRRLEDMGTWPRMKGLPIEGTVANVPATARYIKSELRKKLHQIPEELSDQLTSIKSNIDFIRPRFPLILFEGKEVRDSDHNEWVRNEKNGVPVCGIYKYTIDDGNSRATAYALSGKRSSPALFGVK